MDYGAIKGQEGTIDYSNTPQIRLLTEDSFALTLEHYILAKEATERARRIVEKTDEPTAEARVALLDAANAWRKFEDSRRHTLLLAELLKRLEKATEKKVAWNMLPDGNENLFISRAYAAEQGGMALWRDTLTKDYEQFKMGDYISNTTQDLVNVENGTLSQQIYAKTTYTEGLKSKEEWEKTKSSVMKWTGVGVGIALIPVGLGAGMMGVGAALEAGTALGAAQAGVGLVATMAGGLSTALSVGESGSGNEFQGTNKRIKNYTDLIAMVSGGANVVLSVHGNAMQAKEAFDKWGVTYTNKDLYEIGASQYMGNMDATSKVLFANDAKSSMDTVKAMWEQGMDFFIETGADGEPVVVVKEKLKMGDAKRYEDMTDEEIAKELWWRHAATTSLDTEIKERESKIDELKKHAEEFQEDEDWAYKKSCGMTKKEWEKRRDELRAQEEAARKFLNYIPDGKEYDAERDAAIERLRKAEDALSNFENPYYEYIVSKQYEEDQKKRKEQWEKTWDEIGEAMTENAKASLDLERQKREEKQKKEQEAEQKKQEELAKQIAKDKQSGDISGKTTSPYAIDKVVGTYNGHIVYNGQTPVDGNVVVSSAGPNQLHILSTSTHEGLDNDLNPYLITNTVYDGTVAYNEDTGHFNTEGDDNYFSLEGNTIVLHIDYWGEPMTARR